MSGLDQLLFFFAGWFSDHAYPTLAGLIGGIVGAELRERWRRRRRSAVLSPEAERKDAHDQDQHPD